MDKTTNTIGATFEINVYGDDNHQIWVATLNQKGVDVLRQTQYVLIGRCHVLLTESQDDSEITELSDVYELPPINAIGCLNDGMSIVRILERIEDKMPFG